MPAAAGGARRIGTGGAHRVLLSLRVVHPVPSLINALVVAAIALVASADAGEAALLGLAMFGFQASIGAVNDVVDLEHDRVARSTRPLVVGLIDTRTAIAMALAGAALGLVISAAFGAAVLVAGSAGHACGLAYDLRLRDRGLGWACYAAAFPLLLCWTWLAAAGSLPPGSALLLPLAALAGPTIHLANGLADLEADATAGVAEVAGLAGRLGPRRAPIVLTILTAFVHALAWGVLLLGPVRADLAVVVALAASIVAALGVAGSWRQDARSRELGWLLQAVAMGVLAVACLATLAAAPS
jgi:4-hydroxybenzoate polyprenyltransferase